MTKARFGLFAGIAVLAMVFVVVASRTTHTERGIWATAIALFLMALGAIVAKLLSRRN